MWVFFSVWSLHNLPVTMLSSPALTVQKHESERVNWKNPIVHDVDVFNITYVLIKLLHWITISCHESNKCVKLSINKNTVKHLIKNNTSISEVCNFYFFVMQPHCDYNPEELGCVVQAAGEVWGRWDSGRGCHALPKTGLQQQIILPVFKIVFACTYGHMDALFCVIVLILGFLDYWI